MRMDKSTWFIPGNVPSSKNSRINTRTRSFPSKATAKYYRESEQFWEEHRDEFIKSLKEYKTPYFIGFHFIRKTIHKYDWINPLQTVQDRMVKHGWIEDDNVNIMFPFPLEINGKLTTHYPEGPGVIIKILNN